MCFVGIDIGTSSISCVTYSVDSRKVKSLTVPNDSCISSSNSWESLQNPARVLEIVYRIITDISSNNTTIRGIGVTGQMHGILYLNEDGDAVSPLYTWQDGRASRYAEPDITYAEVLSNATGHPIAAGFGLATHFYNSRNGLVPDGVKKICTIIDYVVMKLVGQKIPVTDYSNGAGLGLFDVEHRCFDDIALQKAVIDRSLLPDLAESTRIYGHYRGIPVYTGLGDNQAAFWGSVRDLHASIHITVGTSSQISVYSENYVRIPGIDTRPFPGGGYMLVGAALCGGRAFAVLQDFFKKTVAKFSPSSVEGLDFYETMTSSIYQGNSTDIPIVETFFDGMRSMPNKRGKIENISSNNFTPDNLINGFLKGIGRELYEFYQAFPKGISAGRTTLVGSGNGLKKNPLLCRVFEEQFGAALTFPPFDEEAAFGACLNAMSGCRTQRASNFDVYTLNEIINNRDTRPVAKSELKIE